MLSSLYELGVYPSMMYSKYGELISRYRLIVVM